MFYLGVFAIVLSVFAVSALAMQGILPLGLESLTAHSWLPMALMATACLLVYGAYRTFQSTHLADGLIIHPTKLMTQSLIVAALVAVFCFKTLLDFERFYALVPSTAVTVTANVRIDEISDGVYDSMNPYAYRQKAVLTDITPVFERVGKTLNPFYHKELTYVSPPPSALPAQMTVLLRTNLANEQDLNALKVGTTAKMTLNLTALPSTPDNSVGFDTRRYLMTRHIHADARILSIDSINKTDVAWYDTGFVWLQGLRQTLRTHFYDAFIKPKTQANEQSAAAVTLSLLTGDRALIDGQTKQLYQWAGMSHLLAISGAHVLFLAVLLTKLVVWAVNQWTPRLYYYIARWQLRWCVMLISAFVYALFVGADVPAMRTVYLLLAVGVLKWLLVNMSISRALALVGLVMIYINPMSLWQAGFWLSFVAVWLLMCFGMAEDGRTQTVRQLIKMQLYLFVAMLPISMLLFGKVSVVGVISNLFMVGLFGYVIVPINLLAGLLYGLVPSLAHILWQFIITVLSHVHFALMVMQLNFNQAWLITPMSVMMVALGFVLIVILQSPWLHRHWLILPMLMMTFAMSGTKAKTNGIYVLPSNFAVQQTLIVKDEVYWLIISSDGKAHINDEKFADELLITLKRFGLTRLNGVVLQHDNEKLAYAIGRISLQMPVDEFWFAGESKRFGNVTARACIMDKTWQEHGLSIRALTGWQTLNNPQMHTCQIWVGVDGGVMPIYSDKTTFYESSAKKLPADTSRGVLIEADSDDKVWALWQLLCSTAPDVEAIVGRNVSKAKMEALFGRTFVQSNSND